MIIYFARYVEEANADHLNSLPAHCTKRATTFTENSITEQETMTLLLSPTLELVNKDKCSPFQALGSWRRARKKGRSGKRNKLLPRFIFRSPSVSQFALFLNYR